MTAPQLWALLLRRWYVLVAVVACGALVGIVLPSNPGVWYSRVDVAFITPNSPQRIGNALEGDNESLINFAAAVERQLNGSWKPLQLSSVDATIYGAGVRRGYTVTLPNPGGQWQAAFDRPILRIEVVDSSEELVRDRVDDLATEIAVKAADNQDLLAVPAARRIRTELTQQTPTVSFVPGSRTRALAVLGLLTTGSSVAAAVVVDRAMVRRRRPTTIEVVEADRTPVAAG